MTLLTQLKERRKDLDLKQSDMYLRVGISRQQYQQIESKGNPRLDTLELIAQGLDSRLMLIPKNKVQQVLALLKADNQTIDAHSQDSDDIINNPWKGLLDDLDD